MPSLVILNREPAGHDRTATTEQAYRHEIRPALTQGAEVMDRVFA
jgi:hypothetical protein